MLLTFVSTYVIYALNMKFMRREEEFCNKFLKAIIIHHQHKYLLRIYDELHGYMFRQISGHFQTIQIHKIEIKITKSF